MSPSRHHWKELSIRDGKLICAAPGKPEGEYLATPEVRITSKKDAVPERDDPRVAFVFELNCAPDPVWQELLAARLDDVPPGIIRPEFKVEITNTQLRIICLASHLERVYPFVKNCVTQTNQAYQQEKVTVLQHVKAAAEHRTAPVPLAESKTEVARDKLSQLEL